MLYRKNLLIIGNNEDRLFPVNVSEIARFMAENGINFVLAEKKALDPVNCNNLMDLESMVRNFEDCDIKKTAKRTVFSDGNPESDVMVVGEAPGLNEDEMGIPFCGKSGKLLNKMFEAIGLTREDLYITNMVFWRPPGNRNPSNEEIELCKPFVEKHIALINPKILVLTGGFAACTLLEMTQGISKLRGKFYQYTNRYMKASITTTPIFHPSYLLRNPKHKVLAWEDLKMIQKYLACHSCIKQV